MTRVLKTILGLFGIAIIAFCLFVGGFMGDKYTSQNEDEPKEENKTIKEEILFNSDQERKLDIEQYGESDISLDHQIDSFINSVLKSNKRKHLKDDLENSDIGHLQIFNKDGLNNYYAFSDNRYPQQSQPTYYENFTLFTLEYNDVKSATNSFRTVYKNSNLKSEQIDSLRNHNHELLRNINTSLKPGGLICQRNNYLFSLVKTCRKPPILNSWKEYEELFIKSIATDEQTINTLNATCGMMNYKFEKRKPTDNK